MSEENQRREIMPVKISESGVIKPANLHEAIEVSKLIAHSGMVPKDYIGKPGAVLVAIEMGHELGLSPMSAIQNIAVINGRPSLWGDAMLALCASHRDCEDIVETLDEKTMTATCMVKRRGRSPVERTFSMADAKTAGLAGKQGPWSQYPKRMLQQRARGFALRDAFPDALRGVVSREEAYDTIHVSQDPLEIIQQIPEEKPKEGRTSYRTKKKDTPEPDEAETMPPHDSETGEVIEQQSEDLTRVLAGIANTEAWDELFLMAKEVNKLKGIDKETAKEAYSKRKAEIETAREPGAEG